MTDERTCLADMTPAELAAWCAGRGMPAFRGRQIFRWIHRGADFPEMTDLPAHCGSGWPGRLRPSP